MTNDVERPGYVEPYTTDDVARHRAAWVAALRSGRYRQATGAMRRPLRSGLTVMMRYHDVPLKHRSDKTKSGFCCLGVAECVRGAVWEFDAGNNVTPYVVNELRTRASLTLSSEGQRWLGVNVSDPYVTVYDVRTHHWTYTSLSRLNDKGLTHQESWSFTQIADVVEGQLPEWNGLIVQTRARALKLNASEVTT